MISASPSSPPEAAAAPTRRRGTSSSSSSCGSSPYSQQQHQQPPPHHHSHSQDDDDMEEEHNNHPNSKTTTSATTKTTTTTTTTSSTTTGSTSTTTTGRKGDPRMHRAVAARLADPSLTLFQALVLGGFTDYTVDDYTISSCMDSDHVTLAQRKNQLSRRLRLAKRQHSTTPTAAAAVVQGNKAATGASKSCSSSSSSAGHCPGGGGVAVVSGTIMNHSQTVVASSIPGRGGGGGGVANSNNSSITLALGGTPSMMVDQQNQGLAEMLRQQRESFRLLQQQQIMQQQGQQKQQQCRPASGTTTTTTGTNAAAAAAASSSSSLWSSWDNGLLLPTEDDPSSKDSSGASGNATTTSPSASAAASPPPPRVVLQAKDHPDFHPIIVARVGGIGSACIGGSSVGGSSENINNTNNSMTTQRHQSHTIADTATNAIVPTGGNDHSSSSSNSSNNITPLGLSQQLLQQHQRSLNRSTSLSTTMAAAAASTEQALAAQAQQEQHEQQQAQAFLTNSATTKMHPSGLALHSISKTAQSLGMTLELFALALASADAQRLSEVLHQTSSSAPAAAPAAAAAGDLSDESLAAKGQDDGGSASTRLALSSPLRTTTTMEEEDSPLTRQEELALQLHMHEAKTLYSKCMLLAGFSSEQAAPDNPTAVRFSLQAWERERQRLQQRLKTQHEGQEQANQQQQQQQDASDENSTIQTDQPRALSGSNNSTFASTMSSAKRKRVCNSTADYDSTAAASGTGGVCTKINSTEGQCTFFPGLHIHRLEGKCGHKAIVHNPKDGPAHIDFVVGTKVECYHQLRPLQATTIVSEEDLAGDEIGGACTAKNASYSAVGGEQHCDDKLPSPTLTPQNTTIWPSQFKCQDLSCSMACSKLKPMDEQVLQATRANSGIHHQEVTEGFGNSLDGTTIDEGMANILTADQHQHEQSTAAVAATLANSYFNMNPRIFDLNDLDLESGEWNWDLNENDVGGFLGLFRLGDTVPPLPAASTTTTTTTELPPITTAAATTDTPPTSPKTSGHRANGSPCGSGKRIKQLEILQEHLQHHEEEEGEEPPPKKKKKKKKK